MRSWVPLVAVVLLAGCSSAAPSERSAEGPLAGRGASAAQAAEIIDRVATADEYEAAFQRYRECMSKAGFELADVEFANSVYEFGVLSAAVENGADDECYVSEFRYTDELWQTSDAVENNSVTAQLFRKCLGVRGIEPGNSLKEMVEQLREARIEMRDCL